jgi:hypothetical protein
VVLFMLVVSYRICLDSDTSELRGRGIEIYG